MLGGFILCIPLLTSTNGVSYNIEIIVCSCISLHPEDECFKFLVHCPVITIREQGSIVTCTSVYRLQLATFVDQLKAVNSVTYLRCFRQFLEKLGDHIKNNKDDSRVLN